MESHEDALHDAEIACKLRPMGFKVSGMGGLGMGCTIDRKWQEELPPWEFGSLELKQSREEALQRSWGSLGKG